ncbi:hypothetical protein AMTRI_Chr01g113580 [Amborella trichopoda]|uniref:AP2/ERF domain-containing protein n=1 Tax=Amborella trichopoda TaxID=13333 RepID=W1PXI3_AMBTC|nr:ethylene-responsive transcription factor ERF015 [Amborella trichopoda]ERN12586.1 hypothetical protein AMTR_s00025p00218200 [Amborella trichopoda]|eukprot:XP_006851005.1 ethylene-responsive transcription factor ERF015 [Amborella trichopoda]
MAKNKVAGKCNFHKKSVFRGIRMRKWGKWVSEIRMPKSQLRIWLGSYDSPEKAARAYDAALYCLRGSNCHFNFPGDKRPNLPLNFSPSILDIKAIAARSASPENFTAEKKQKMASNLSSSESEQVSPSLSSTSEVSESMESSFSSDRDLFRISFPRKDLLENVECEDSFMDEMKILLDF